jgi:hypothetical protein
MQRLIKSTFLLVLLLIALNNSVYSNQQFTPINSRTFVEQQYRDFLGRDGESAGIEFWVAKLNSGELTQAQVVDNFFRSEEFQGKIAPIARLYFAYFLRIPDYASLQSSIKHYLTGTPLNDISQGFASSQEFVQRYGQLTNEPFVERVYQNVLQRAPDPNERAHWLDLLNKGMARGEMMTGFSESPDYRNKSYNAV